MKNFFWYRVSQSFLKQVSKNSLSILPFTYPIFFKQSMFLFFLGSRHRHGHLRHRGRPEFLLSGNPFSCDCSMEWLQQINDISLNGDHPFVADLDEVGTVVDDVAPVAKIVSLLSILMLLLLFWLLLHLLQQMLLFFCFF